MLIFLYYSSHVMLDLDKFHACIEICQISRTKWTPVNEQNKVAKQRRTERAVLRMGVPWTVTFMLDISEKDLVKLCLLFYNVIRWSQGQKLQKPFVLARLGFWAWDPQKHEDAAIFKENQRIRMFLELRKLHSNGAIRGYQFGAKYLLTTTSTHAPVY